MKYSNIKRVIHLGRKMINDAEKMYGGDDHHFNTLLRIGNELVRFKLPFQKRSLSEFSIEDRTFIKSYVEMR